MKLGFPVAVNSRPALRAYDARHPRAAGDQGPHLSVSLAYLHDILRFLVQAQIRFYRLASHLVPYAGDRTLAAVERQLDECQVELRHIGQLARDAAVRLSIHADATIVLNNHDETQAAHSAQRLANLAALLDHLEAGLDAVVVVHVGGLYRNKPAAMARFCRRFVQLPTTVQARTAVEHDHDRYSLIDTWQIHRETGVRLVFDRLHHQNHNPEGADEFEALGLALSTWPRGVHAKVHIASPRTEFNQLTAGEAGGTQRRVLRPPRWTQHGDYVNPFEFIDWLRRVRAAGLPEFDIMLEARARDLALLRLRADLRQYAPDLAAMVT